MGDPIELAAIHSLGWSYDAPTSTASAADPLPKLDAAIKKAEADLAVAKKKAAGMGAAGAQPSAVQASARAHAARLAHAS